MARRLCGGVEAGEVGAVGIDQHLVRRDSLLDEGAGGEAGGHGDGVGGGVFRLFPGDHRRIDAAGQHGGLVADMAGAALDHHRHAARPGGGNGFQQGAAPAHQQVALEMPRGEVGEGAPYGHVGGPGQSQPVAAAPGQFQPGRGAQRQPGRQEAPRHRGGIGGEQLRQAALGVQPGGQLEAVEAAVHRHGRLHVTTPASTRSSTSAWPSQE